MRSLLVALVGAATVMATLARAGDARACGGCFIAQSTNPTVVSGHRMAMSISKEQTVLWDQIQYQGEPEEFAWVLPVKAGARVEEATDAFFEALEATTRTSVTGAELNCGPTDSGCSFGCGDDAEAGSDGGYNSPTSPVEVVHQGSVGPYETVTLSTATPGALNAWLQDHGYNVDPASQPVVDQYVAEGFDFIALRLQPGLDVAQMKPVRVVMPGGGLTLPLRMVAIGTGAQTPLVLYLIGEGRYTIDNLNEVTVPPSLVVWDYQAQTSNYEVARKEALEQHGGLSFLTTFAAPNLFLGSSQQPGVVTGPSQFLSLYADQAKKNGEAASSCVIKPPQTNVPVGNPCPDGQPLEGSSCMEPLAAKTDARLFGCPGAYDVSMALIGMQSGAWVTRVEADLPRAALASDLTIRAAEQKQVSNVFVAGLGVNAEKVCAPFSMIAPSPEGKRPPPPLRVGPYVLAFGALALVLRRRLRSGWRAAPSFGS